jgi:hypothetical protein
MNFEALALILFSSAILISAVWANSSYAQMLQPGTTLPQETPSSTPSTSPSNSSSTTISSELKAKMCDPNNPKLQFVNATESKICGLPHHSLTPKTTTSTTPSPKPISPSENPTEQGPVPGLLP